MSFCWRRTLASGFSGIPPSRMNGPRYPITGEATTLCSMASTATSRCTPSLLGERHRLAKSHHLDDQAEVDGHLHLGCRAAVADVAHLGTDRLQHRLHPLEGRPVASHHDRRLPLRQRDRAARDGGIEHGQASGGEGVGDRSGLSGIDRAHVEVDRSGSQPGDDPVIAERHLPHGGGVGHDRDDRLGAPGDLARGVGPCHADLEERRRLLDGPVPTGDRVPGIDQTGD